MYASGSILEWIGVSFPDLSILRFVVGLTFGFGETGGVVMGLSNMHFQINTELLRIRRLLWWIICSGMQKTSIGMSLIFKLFKIGRWIC